MAEGRAEQERQPIISNLFPVSEQSVLTAFEELSPRENPSGAQAEANRELDRLSETNPHVLDYNEGILLQIPREAGDQLFEGILECHRALREEAKVRGGILPTFTDEFIEEFHNKRVESLRAMIVNKKLAFQQAVNESVKLRLDEFQNLEPEFSKIVREKLSVKPDWDPEKDFKYLGIINTYLLFREGCEDRKNFQESPR